MYFPRPASRRASPTIDAARVESPALRQARAVDGYYACDAAFHRGAHRWMTGAPIGRRELLAHATEARSPN